MNLRTLFLAAVATTSVVAAAPAMAQDSWGPDHGDYRGDHQSDRTQGPPQTPGYGQDQRGYDHGRPGFDQDQRGGDVRDREQRVSAWMSQGHQQGWLHGWRERKAVRMLNQIQRQDREARWQNHGSLRPGQRFELNRQLDQLTSFLRETMQVSGQPR